MSAALTWLGTNSLLLSTDSGSLLIDPYFGAKGAENASTAESFARLCEKSGVRDILVSHGHFDHLSSIPALVSLHPSVVYATRCAVEGLALAGCPDGCVVKIEPGDVFEIGQVKVEVFQGRHIRFDARLVLSTLSPRNIARAPKNVPVLLPLIARYKECKETVVYDITIPGAPAKRLQVLGSLALDDATDYRAGADYMVLPYQGSSDLVPNARRVVRRMVPKHVIASHFDDAFPPVTNRIDTSSLETMMAREFPDIGFTVPVAGEPLFL